MRKIRYFILIISYFILKYSIAQDYAPNQLLGDFKDFNMGLALEVNSRTLGSKPCPIQTDAERLINDVIWPPGEGDCYWSQDQKAQMSYNGTVWEKVGGGTNISAWLPAHAYKAGDIYYAPNTKDALLVDADHTSSAVSLLDDFWDFTSLAWSNSSYTTSTFRGGLITLNAGVLDVTEGIGVVFRNNNSPFSTLYKVKWNETLGLAPAVANNWNTIYVSRDTADLKTMGTVQVVAGGPDENTYKDFIVLGIYYPPRNILINLKSAADDPGNSIRSMNLFFELMIKGMSIVGNPDRTFITNSGKLFFPGVSPNAEIPDIKSCAAQAVTNFDLFKQDGFVANTTNVDTSQWDDAGTLSAIGGTKWSCVKVFVGVDCHISLQYCQGAWNTLNEATVGEKNTRNSYIVESSLRQVSRFQHLIFFQNGNTDLSDQNLTYIDFGGIFGLGSAGSGAGGATGDVLGPATSTDNAIALFDGASGKILKNSVTTINNSGLINITNANGGYLINKDGGTTPVTAGLWLNDSGGNAVGRYTPGIYFGNGGVYHSRLHVKQDDTNSDDNGTLEFQTNAGGFSNRTPFTINYNEAWFNNVVSATAYTTRSDSSLKENIANSLLSDATFNSLSPKQYTWKDRDLNYTTKDTQTHYGFIAQEVEAILPSAVYTDKDGKKSIDYAEIVSAAILKIQQLKGKLATGTDNAIIKGGANGAYENSGVYITDTDNIGIGTDSPYKALDVVGDIVTSFHGNASQHDASEKGSRFIGNQSGNTLLALAGMQVVVKDLESDGVTARANNTHLAWYTWGNTIANSREVMRLTERGRLGINMTNPATELQVNGNATIGPTPVTAANAPVGVGRLQLLGANGNNGGPHMSFNSDSDKYPSRHFLNWSHDNIWDCFDCYYDGASYRNSTASSSFRLQKTGTDLIWQSQPNPTAGGNEQPVNRFWINENGNSTFANDLQINGKMNVNGTIIAGPAKTDVLGNGNLNKLTQESIMMSNGPVWWYGGNAGAGNNPMPLPVGFNGLRQANANFAGGNGCCVWTPAIRAAGSAFYVYVESSWATAVGPDRTDHPGVNMGVSPGWVATYVSNGTTWEYQGKTTTAEFNAGRTAIVSSTNPGFGLNGQVLKTNGAGVLSWGNDVLLLQKEVSDLKKEIGNLKNSLSKLPPKKNKIKEKIKNAKKIEKTCENKPDPTLEEIKNKYLEEKIERQRREIKSLNEINWWLRH